MREILFRGKRLDNGEWVEGFYVRADLHWHEKGIHNDWIVCSACANGGWLALCKRHPVDPSTVGQYTGLTANGKKIFEGDIVKYKNTDGIKFNGVALTVIGKVVYNEKNASFAISGKDEIGAKHYDYFTVKNIEVIGNKWDNPELLEDEG